MYYPKALHACGLQSAHSGKQPCYAMQQLTGYRAEYGIGLKP